MRERFENLRQSYQSSNDVQRDELISLLLFLYDSTHDGPKLVRNFRQITSSSDKFNFTENFCFHFRFGPVNFV